MARKKIVPLQCLGRDTQVDIIPTENAPGNDTGETNDFEHSERIALRTDISIR